MPSTKRKSPEPVEATWYKGKQAKTGNSLGLRFDKALFHSHPEFKGTVKARILGPGRMLVVAERSSKARHEEDPVIASFLSFLAADMVRSPNRIRPLSPSFVARMDRLTKGVASDPDEYLGDEPLI